MGRHLGRRGNADRHGAIRMGFAGEDEPDFEGGGILGGAIRSPYHVAAMLESASATKPVAERPAAALLSVRDLVIEFQGERGSSTVVNGISLDLFSGQTLAVVGESGSGKSVTALGILRLLPPTA